MIFILSAFLIFTVSSQQAEAKSMWGKVEIQDGMIGKIQILKDTDLFTLSKGKLKFVKKLKKGNEHGVYGETKNMGGLYKLSGINYVKKSNSIKYVPIPKKVYSTKEIVKLNDEKIVLISTNKGQGSGVVVGTGLILTNHHVIDGASEATVTFTNGQQYKVAGIVESDAKKDIALLKTTKTFKTTSVSIRPSSKGLSKGEKVVAIGSPKGLQNTVSEGIISSFRNNNGVSEIQTNADIDNGSSGGALFDVSGQLIGMTSSGYDSGSANLNFAVATEEFVPMVNKYFSKKYDSIKASFPLPTPDLTPVLGDIALGMTMEQVMDLSGGYFESKTSSHLYYYDVNVLGYQAKISYEFKDNKLVAINVFHDIVMNQSDLDILEAFFIVMYDDISKSYGAADYIDTDWSDDEDGYVLSAHWDTPDHSTLLMVKVTMEYDTFGGIRISILG